MPLVTCADGTDLEEALREISREISSEFSCAKDTDPGTSPGRLISSSLTTLYPKSRTEHLTPQWLTFSFHPF